MRKEYEDIILEYDKHTLERIKSELNKYLPVVHTGRILNSDRYCYKGKKYWHNSSIDTPEDNFGIVYVENMPYNNTSIAKSENSFVSRLDTLIHDNIIQPVLLFINNRFVRWESIDVVFDNGDTWLKIYGTKYLYRNIKKADMIILPFGVTYVSTEPDYLFDRYFEAICQYMIDSASIRIVRGVPKLTINIPRINTKYEKDGSSYDIGMWYYNQVKLYYSGLLSDDRITKLKKINLVKYEYSNNTVTNIYNTIVNLLDEDSIIKAQLNELKGIGNKDTLINNAIFRFDDNGILDMESGDIMISLSIPEESDMCEYICHRVNTHHNVSNYTNYNYSNINAGNVLFRENYIIFRDGMLYNHYNNIEIGNNYTTPINGYKLINNFNYPYNSEYAANGIVTEPDAAALATHDITVMTFYYDRFEILDHMFLKFPNVEKVFNDFIEYINSSNKSSHYMNYLISPLSYDYEYDDFYPYRLDNTFDILKNYDNTIFNKLYDDKVKYQSIQLHYLYANTLIRLPASSTEVDDDNLYLHIPLFQSMWHESYAMVFVNGLLIDNYCFAKIFNNKMLIPINTTFTEEDCIEILYFNNCNNNDLGTLKKTVGGDIVTTDYWNAINNAENMDQVVELLTQYKYKLYPIKDEVRFFTGEYQVGSYDILQYDLNYDEKEIAFPINNINYFKKFYDNGLSIIISSKNKFVYQNFVIKNKGFKLKLSDKFKYCDNPRQYMLFINGRRINHYDFIITLPTFERPFNEMYLYTARFITKGDRVELFYTPLVCNDFAYYNNLTINENGYFDISRELLPYQITPNDYIIFINGKKVANNDILNITTSRFKITKDYNSRQHLSIIPLIDDSDFTEIEDYFHNGINSKWEKAIEQVFSMSDPILRLNTLYNTNNIISANEQDYLWINVGRIAILNEIVRDFWVSNGYDYNKDPFVYEFYTRDGFISQHNKDTYNLDTYPRYDYPAIKYDDDTGLYIIPALDAEQNINIDKDELQHDYFYWKNKDFRFVELGTILNPGDILLEWEYNDHPYDNLGLEEQIIYIYIDGAESGNVSLPINYRSYTPTIQFNSNSPYDHRIISFILSSYDGIDRCNSKYTFKFVNGIYYGNVPEDKLDKRDSDEYLNPIRLAELIRYPSLTKVLIDEPVLTLDDYEIGQNNYFVVALPSRFLNDTGIEFFISDLDDVKDRYQGDNNQVIYTNGIYDMEDEDPKGYLYDDIKYYGIIERLDNIEMEIIGVVQFNNGVNGFTEEYTVIKSNGFFTGYQKDIKLNIHMRDKR